MQVKIIKSVKNLGIKKGKIYEAKEDPIHKGHYIIWNKGENPCGIIREDYVQKLKHLQSTTQLPVQGKEITAKYKFKEDYDTTYINGVTGRVAGSGEIVMHFFNERPAVPNEMKYELLENGLQNGTVTDPKSIDSIVIRSVKVGITLNLDSAKSIRNWLNNRIDELKAIENGKNIFKNKKS